LWASVSAAVVAIALCATSVSAAGRPLGFAEIAGRWRLMYSGRYGFEFTFTKNYRAICVMYLRSHAYVFRGVYTIEEGDRIRFNVSDMKNEKSAGHINLKSGFVKASSSYFIFHAGLDRSRGRPTLVLKPERIIIDGRNSDGYFEPEMRLEKSG